MSSGSELNCDAGTGISDSIDEPEPGYDPAIGIARGRAVEGRECAGNRPLGLGRPSGSRLEIGDFDFGFGRFRQPPRVIHRDGDSPDLTGFQALGWHEHLIVEVRDDEAVSRPRDGEQDRFFIEVGSVGQNDKRME